VDPRSADVAAPEFFGNPYAAMLPNPLGFTDADGFESISLDKAKEVTDSGKIGEWAASLRGAAYAGAQGKCTRAVANVVVNNRTDAAEIKGSSGVADPQALAQKLGQKSSMAEVDVSSLLAGGKKYSKDDLAKLNGKMPEGVLTYKYKALDKDGKVVKESFHAELVADGPGNKRALSDFKQNNVIPFSSNARIKSYEFSDVRFFVPKKDETPGAGPSPSPTPNAAPAGGASAPAEGSAPAEKGAEASGAAAQPEPSPQPGGAVRP
ncbi:MAG TPA: hypothetical protein VGK73_12130, partial [Polyangiaceae bacterium]